MTHRPHAQNRSLWNLALLTVLAALTVPGLRTIHAQTGSSCFPTCDESDGRMITIAGPGFSTLANEEVVLKLAADSSSPTLEFGIFDGETGGQWDQDTTSLMYTLYADPDGDGVGDVEIATLYGYDMVDNGWKTYQFTNHSVARAANGNYLYVLRIHSTDPHATYWSSFKIRTTTGTVALKAQSFTMSTTARTLDDFRTLYPNVDFLAPDFDPSTLLTATTTYDGTWSLFLDVDRRGDSLDVWDGDLDHGDYNCVTKDSDDPNTPNDVLPPWADPDVVNYEGVASGMNCQGGGRTTGNPPDDHPNPAFRRSPSVWYQVLDPNGNVYSNHDPSGNLEWEVFRIGTANVAAAARDAMADSLPSGIYQVRINGLDIQNVSGWRFYFDALGVDADGNPTPELQPFSLGGRVCLADDEGHRGHFEFTRDDDRHSHQRGRGHRSHGNGHGYGHRDHRRCDNGSSDEDGLDCRQGLSDVRIVVDADYDRDGVFDATMSTTTDDDGRYSFPNMRKGNYRVSVDATTLPSGVEPADDYDGIDTPNQAVADITDASANDVFFKYESSDGDDDDGQCATARSASSWSDDCNAWPTQRLSIAGRTYSSRQLRRLMCGSSNCSVSAALARELIAARLNVASGACDADCIGRLLDRADSWLSSHGGVDGCVSAHSSAWRSTGSQLMSAIESFNHGDGCSSGID